MKWIAACRDNFKLRPWWMNGILLFCAYMTVIYVPWDMLSKPVSAAQEVWFGYLLTGWSAKATEPLHGLIYGAGCWGIWHMKSWMHPWGIVYVLQIAFGMFVWNLVDERGGAVWAGALVAVPFLLLALALWRNRSRFSN